MGDARNLRGCQVTEHDNPRCGPRRAPVGRTVKVRQVYGGAHERNVLPCTAQGRHNATGRGRQITESGGNVSTRHPAGDPATSGRRCDTGGKRNCSHDRQPKVAGNRSGPAKEHERPTLTSARYRQKPKSPPLQGDPMEHLGSANRHAPGTSTLPHFLGKPGSPRWKTTDGRPSPTNDPGHQSAHTARGGSHDIRQGWWAGHDTTNLTRPSHDVTVPCRTEIHINRSTSGACLPAQPRHPTDARSK